MKKLYYWLDGFSNDSDFKNSPYKGLIDDFRDKIYKHTNANPRPTPNDGELKNWDNASNKKFYDALKKICAGLDWEPQKCFSDKLLLFIAPEGAEFRHDEKEKFVPRKIEVDQDNRVYVIPPISIDVIDSLKKGAQIATGDDDGWNVVYDDSKKVFTAECTLRSQDGKDSRNDAKEMSDFLAALDDESDEDSSIDVRPEQPTEPDNPNFDLPDADGMKKVFVAMAKLENSNQQNTESDKKSMLQNIKENFGEKYKNLRGGVKNKVSGTETDEFFFKNVSTALMLYAMIDEELGE